MPKIKEVYEYNNGSWANGTPIGADASNVDVALSDSTSTKDLQTVLGNVSVSDPSMKTQLTGKVNASGGDIKDTVVSVLDPASETDTSEDIDGTDVVVAAGESQTTMWSKFNMFRKRVSNKFSNFLISSVEDVVTPSDTKTYSQAALNSYFADVIGYKTDADVATVGSVADQLSTLNNNAIILFDDDNVAINSPITLSDSAANYEMFVICYKDNDRQFNSMSVMHPNGKTISLFMSAVTVSTNQTGATYYKVKSCIIKNNTIRTYQVTDGNHSYSTGQHGFGVMSSSGSTNITMAFTYGDYINITQVIGFKTVQF
jgi:hypothetical protein